MMTHDSSVVKLSGIPETMLIPLWARAEELRRPHPILRDHKAAEIVRQIDYDFTKFSKAWKSQVGITIRSIILDTYTRKFLDEHKKAVVVNLGSGLDTRYERLKEDRILCWYDIDLPESIEIRRAFFAESPSNRFIARSVFDYSWIDEIRETNWEREHS